jgi:molybdate transport system ATP-binding protein
VTSDVAAGLHAHVLVQRGDLAVDVALHAEPGEVVAVLGPNGAGKSTVLRCLGGLLPIDDGRIVLDGVVLDAPADRVFVPPERRPVGVVFQDFLLFAHLSALENVAFGLRATGTGAREARSAAAERLAAVGLTEHAQSRPAQLSGGQAQRVALARALATRPRLLLLDEPLAALDATTRASVRRDLREHLASFAGVRILVTHDPVDAYALADRMVVIEAGRVVQEGSLPEVTAHPRSRYVGDLVGMNVVSGSLEHGRLETDSGATLVSADVDAASGAAFAAIRPSAIALHTDSPSGSARNVWQCTVEDLDRRGERVRVLLAGELALVAEITADALAALALRPGDVVFASVKATEVSVYPA